jgi:2,4-dienoyl-CoA reductase-like NADH-dependent reductase (Old Yellow Enzyme family)
VSPPIPEWDEWLPTVHVSRLEELPPNLSPRPRHSIPEEAWPGAAEAAASLLFSPLTLGSGLELEQRTWVPAMVPWRASEDGLVTPEVLDWYRRFARGRPAVIVVEATGIRDVPSGPLLRIGHERLTPGLSELVAVVKEASEGHTRLLIQLIDFLAIRRRPARERYLKSYLALTPEHISSLCRLDPELDPDDEHLLRAALVELDDDTLAQVLSAREWNDLTRGYREQVTDVHLPHVAELPRTLPGLFSDAADRARRAGFDGVELHFAHAYTMASFLSPLNDRADGYGGSAEHRRRLPLEVLAAVRARVGADYTVGCRMLGDEVIPGGGRLQDAAQHAVAFAAAGMDFLSISRGGKFEDARQPAEGQAVYPYTGPSGHACMPDVFGKEPPFGLNLPLASGIRAALRAAGHCTPVVASGGINSFALAERALADGSCDLIGAARQSLADPDWFLKLRAGRGADINRCRYTNYCEALDQKHVPVTCQLWDRVALDEPGAALSRDGRRRLVAPTTPWRPRHDH